MAEYPGITGAPVHGPVRWLRAGLDASVRSMTATRCPTCNISLTSGLDGPLFPFCSQRCKSVDLGNWLSDRYIIDAGAAEDESMPPQDTQERQFNE